MRKSARHWHSIKFSWLERHKLKLAILFLSLCAWGLWATFTLPVAAQEPVCGEGPDYDPPDFYITADPASHAVQGGQTAMYAVGINEINCFSDTVTLSIAGLPDNTTFALDPSALIPPGDSTLTVETSADTPPGTWSLVISGDGAEVHHEVSVDLVVEAPQELDFSIAVTPASRSVDPGDQASYTVNLEVTNGVSGTLFLGFTETVDLAVTGLPAGASATFDPPGLVPPGDSTLTVATGDDTPPGTYALTVSGDSGELYHEASVELIVNETIPPATVSVSPASGATFVGQQTNSQILLSDAIDFYGIEFTMTYDPAVVNVVDANPTLEGVQIGLGDLFPSDQYVVGVNQVDTDAGEIRFGVSRRAPAAPVNGGGVLANVTWEGLGEGHSALNFTHLKLATPSGFEIAAVGQGGTISVTLTGFLQGTVHLQGRTDHSGVQVAVSPGDLEAITDIQGLFDFLTHGVLTVTAKLYGYLEAQTTVTVSPGDSVDLGPTMLYGGEVTGDNCIDILDLSYLGARFHSDDLSADINGDGLVDILDLAMAASNFTKCGPTSWSE